MTASAFTAKIAHAGVLASELPSLTITTVSCGRRCSTTCLNWHRGTLRGTDPLSPLHRLLHRQSRALTVGTKTSPTLLAGIRPRRRRTGTPPSLVRRTSIGSALRGRTISLPQSLHGSTQTHALLPRRPRKVMRAVHSFLTLVQPKTSHLDPWCGLVRIRPHPYRLGSSPSPHSLAPSHGVCLPWDRALFCSWNMNWQRQRTSQL